MPHGLESLYGGQPAQRAIWRSARLNAASRQPPDVPAKLPLGREPSTGSADWAH